MPIQPISPVNISENIGFSGLQVPPSSSGDGSRHNKIPPHRSASHKRNLVRWFVPETGVIDMYINPQKIYTEFSKVISKTMTKGGVSLQYFIENPIEISISGTTGTSGVEGINVLYDIYRSEQLSFDPYAQVFAASLDRDLQNDSTVGDLSFLGSVGDLVSGDFTNMITNSLEIGDPSPSRPRPTLASLAFSVEMYWSGWVYRGYFSSFNFNEEANSLGLFDYGMKFTAVQRRGYRANFLPWHKSPTFGPSNSDPDFGSPRSYDKLVSAQGFTPNNQIQENIISYNERLLPSRGYIGDIV